jgi:hypothetical protein
LPSSFFFEIQKSTIADRKYAAHSEADRANLAFQLVHKRAKSTLSFLRPITLGQVGCTFVTNGWIDDTDLEEALTDARERLATQDP